MNGPAKDVLRSADDDAIRLAKTLLRGARHGALATLSPEDGSPQATRVGLATALDGTPLILISGLAVHTAALLADPRCSLLVGETGKGDPLAHSRATISCRARRLERVERDGIEARRRYLARHPKADLGDFAFFALEMTGARLNGGFGRAYELKAAELKSPVPDGLAEAEPDAVEWVNRVTDKGVRATGLDAEGVDTLTAGATGRLWFDTPILHIEELSPRLERLARTGPFTWV